MFNIITNHVPRDIVNGYELSANMRAEFDYIDWDAVDRGETSPEFVWYMGTLYDLGEFETTTTLHQAPELRAWDAYQSDSFFSGHVIRYARENAGTRYEHIDFERVIVGRYYS